jgi:hypothetical protein
MWNKFVEIMQDPSYKRLALAFFASILAHIMLFSGFDFSLPYFKKEMHVIEARIQMPKAQAPKPEVTPPKPKPEPEVRAPAPEKPAPPTPKQEAPPEPLPETVPENTTPAPEPVAVSEPVPPVEPVSVPESEHELQPRDEGLVINENAYQYVETYFDVSTKIDGPSEGKAKTIFNLVDNEHYQLSFLIEAQGVAALFLPDLVQTSDGLLTKTGLQPLNYLYQFGNKTDKTRKATFDWQAKTLQLTTSKGVKTEPLQVDTQDVLSFMYQFMYVAPLQKMHLNITNGKKLREYDYAFEGEENVNSPLGEVKSIHIAHTGTDIDEKIELWLAIDYQYIPVKIRKTEKDGKVYEFVANRVVTTRPTIDSSQQVK